MRILAAVFALVTLCGPARSQGVVDPEGMIRYLRGQAANDVDPFELKVQTFSLNHQTVFEAISRLHEATGVVVSVEKVLSTSEANQADQEFTTTSREACPT